MKSENMLLKIIHNKNILSFLWQGFFGVFEAANIFILIRSYSKPVFGEIVFFFACVNICDFILTGYILSPLIRFLTTAKTESDRKELLGSAWLMGMVIVIFISLLFCIIRRFSPVTFVFLPFLTWYPMIVVCTLPFYITRAKLQANNDFLKIIFIQAVYNLSYFTFLILNFRYFKLHSQYVFVMYALSNGLASIVVLILRWTDITALRYVKKDKVKTLHDFGAFSFGSYIASSLFKNSPILIIGMMMNSVMEAIFNVPYKLITVFSIPLEGCAIVAFNKMSRASANQDKERVIHLYYQYIGVLIILFLPVILVFAIYAKQIIYIFSGGEYANIPATINIFRILLLYILLVTIDRFGGVLLDSINRPYYHLFKVLVMLIFSISGVSAAIYLFKTLESVAVICMATIMLGIYVGTKLINRDIKLNILQIIPSGWDTVKNVVSKENLRSLLRLRKPTLKKVG